MQVLSATPLQVRRVCEMGFSDSDARKALEQHAWDEVAAINALLSN
jgi:UBA/TS-N domain